MEQENRIIRDEKGRFVSGTDNYSFNIQLNKMEKERC